MKAFHPPKALVVVLATCVLWVALLSFLVFGFRGFGVNFGWTLMVALLLAWGVWSVVMAGSRRRVIPQRGFAEEGHPVELDTRPVIAR